MFEFLTA